MSDEAELNPQPRLLNSLRPSFETGAGVIRTHLQTMPKQPGVYRMLNDKGEVLYVGKAKNLKNRVTAYTQRARLPNRIQRMVANTRNMEIVVTNTEAEALLLEVNLIRQYTPPYNIVFRDDRSYPYILITRDHDFPQLTKHRGGRERKGWYFGPFASAGAVAETLTLLQRGFMIRNCSDGFFAARTRPCLQYHIRRCTAPCVGKVSTEDYARQVDDAMAFLRGKNQDIQSTLAAEMQQASDNLEFERAARLRDRIKTLTSIQARQDINVAGIGDADIIALHQEGGHAAIQIFFFRSDRNYGTRTLFPRHDPEAEAGEILATFIAQFYAGKVAPPALFLNQLPDDLELLTESLSQQSDCRVVLAVPKIGDKKRIVDHALQNAAAALQRKLAETTEQAKLLRQVAELFGLPEPPKRIEVYDNSHISGQHAVGGMIAAGPEGFLRKTYRKFNIKSDAAAGDDYAMMTEVLTRRFKRLIEEDPERQSGLWPDLLLIDGGQGQFNKVQSVMQELGIQDLAIVSIAKGPDRNAGCERFFMADREPFDLPIDDPVLFYLQRLRDEAHRFAIGTHRARRTRAISQSGLEDIPGIGATRKKALLHHFGSAKAVAGAGLDDLARVPGISASIARKIYDFYHEG